MVATMRGDVSADGLGRTLMHEHVFVLNPDILENVPTGFDEDVEVAKAITRLDELKAAGIDTIVDLTVIGLGRSLRRLARVSSETDLNIVVATGIYTYHDLPMYFGYRRTGELADYFIGEITDGIGDSGVRAGILKVATDEVGVTRDGEKLLRAIARAHRATGAPISTHTHAGTRRGLEQQAIFRDEGVDPSNVVIGHSGDTTDLDYLEALIGAGSYIGMDRFGVDVMLPFEDRVNTVAELCKRGHAGSMVLSHDASCCGEFSDAVMQAIPNWHFLHISHDVLPALRERGVTEDQIDQMLVDNPRRILAGCAPYPK